MTEVTFRIERDDNCASVTMIEDGIVFARDYYHKETDDGTMIACSVIDWYDVNINDL